MTDNLVLKAISTYNGDLHNGMTKALEAVVAMVLEEAARELDNMPCAPSQGVNDYWQGYRAALTYGAVGIRALRKSND